MAARWVPTVGPPMGRGARGGWGTRWDCPWGWGWGTSMGRAPIGEGTHRGGAPMGEAVPMGEESADRPSLRGDQCHCFGGKGRDNTKAADALSTTACNPSAHPLNR